MTADGIATILIAGVGHLHLRDLAAGPLALERVRKEGWPPHVVVEDFSYGPIAVMHRLDEIGRELRRMIFFGAQQRGRSPGLYEMKWSPPKLDDEEIQIRVEAGATGIIDLENLLIIAGRFGKLSDDVWVVEVEPSDTTWGEELSPVAASAIAELPQRVRRLVEAA